MSYDWTMFFDQFAGDFHPTFQKELSRQLFEKGESQTGIENFSSYNLQLIVGMHDLKIRKDGHLVYALIEFITPTSFSFPVNIYWTVENANNILELHKQDISKMKVDINWCEGFPLKEILPHLTDTERFD